MATNMAPHNLTEVIAAARYLLKHPDASLEQLMKYVPGPDLPTGGHIVGLDGVREAYETGRGIFRTRATATIEQLNARKTGIVVTELPYGVGPEKVITRIKDLVQAKKITGISDLKDLTDRNRGLNLVIEVRAGFNPEAVLAELYRLTPMEETFGINNVALVDGQPRTLGLKELLSIYIEHRVDVTRRRSEFRRQKRQDRLHLVDGILIALLNIDEVIQVIRTSDDSAEAKRRLCQVFDLSEIQAQYILDTPLRRLTRFDKLELEREQETLRAEIAELTEILDNEDMLRNLVSGEMADVAKKFGTPRRTVLMEAGAAVAAAVPLEVTDDPCLVVLSATGLLARVPLDQSSRTERAEPARRGLARRRPRRQPATARPRAARGGPRGLRARDDRPRHHRRGDVGRPDDRFSVLEIPASAAGGRRRDRLRGGARPRRARGGLSGGHPVEEFVPGLADGETVLALAPLDGAEAGGVALGTASGVVKRVQPDYPANRDEFELITLKDDDRVVGRRLPGRRRRRAGLHHQRRPAAALPGASVRPQGRPAAGMAGIRLTDGASVVWFGAIGPGGERAGRGRRRDGRGHGGRPLRRAAGHRRRVRQGHPVRRVPGQGPGHRRRPLPALPQGRGRPDPGLDRPGPGDRRDRVGRHRRPDRHDGRRDGSGNAITRQLAHLARPSASPASARSFGHVGRSSPLTRERGRARALRARRSHPRRWQFRKYPYLGGLLASRSTYRAHLMHVFRDQVRTLSRSWPGRVPQAPEKPPST